MANPFFVDPTMSGIRQGLAGIGQIRANKQLAEQEREDRLNMLQRGKVGTTRMVDTGSEIEVIDTRTGQTLRTIPKGVSPQVQQQSDIRTGQFEQQQALAQQKLAAQTAATQESAALRQQEATAKGEERALKAEETKVKIETAKVKKEEAKQAKIDTGRSALTSLGRVIGTIDQLSAHPGLESAMGATSILPTMPGSDAADFEVLFEQLRSQQFMDGDRKSVV